MSAARFPLRTAQRITACAALGLDYWAASPINSVVWAVDSRDRSVHLVRIDLANLQATHDCGIERYHRSGMMLTSCVGRWASVKFPDVAALAASRGMTTLELMSSLREPADA